MNMPDLDKTLLSRVALAYAIYAPFWIAAFLIIWKFGASSSQSGYIGCLGCLAGILIIGSFVTIVYQAVRAVNLARRKPVQAEFTREIVLNVVVLFFMLFLLLAALPVLTYRFLD